MGHVLHEVPVLGCPHTLALVHRLAQWGAAYSVHWRLAPNAAFSMLLIQPYVPHATCSGAGLCLTLHLALGAGMGCMLHAHQTNLAPWLWHTGMVCGPDPDWPQGQHTGWVQHRHCMLHAPDQPPMPSAVLAAMGLVHAACSTQSQSKTHRLDHRVPWAGSSSQAISLTSQMYSNRC